mmetsp:Transcript_4412/g.6648  ORF Transcript_4412/g.6648 Transcript_4412/m.6648 type:complete len:251 (+) Transcript_4412:1548-2300(+)
MPATSSSWVTSWTLLSISSVHSWFPFSKLCSRASLTNPVSWITSSSVSLLPCSQAYFRSSEFTKAPFSRRNFKQAGFKCFIEYLRGVVLGVEAAALMSTPWDKRISTHSKWPLPTAWCKGESPSWLVCLTLAPFSMSSLSELTAQVLEAMQTGVFPELSGISKLAPFSINIRAHSGLSAELFPIFLPKRPPAQPHTALCRAVLPRLSCLSMSIVGRLSKYFIVCGVPFQAALLKAVLPSKVGSLGSQPFS